MNMRTIMLYSLTQTVMLLPVKNSCHRLALCLMRILPYNFNKTLIDCLCKDDSLKRGGYVTSITSLQLDISLMNFYNVSIYLFIYFLFCGITLMFLGHGNQCEPGWIGFFYTVWLITRKSFGFAKHSLSVTGSAITSYSTSRATRHLVRTDSN
jgi:hypothetical protein